MDSEIYPAWIEVTKTKEGYFVFDVSKLDSGVYYTDLIVDDLCYAFEIV